MPGAASRAAAARRAGRRGRGQPGVRGRAWEWTGTRWAASPAADAPARGAEEWKAEAVRLENRVSALERTRRREHDLANHLQYFARRSTTPLNFGQLLTLDNSSPQELIEFAQFTREEVIIRLAKARKAIDELPYGLSHMPSTRRVMSWYESSFSDMFETEHPTTPAQVNALLPPLSNIFVRHAPTMQTVSRGVIELKSRLERAGDKRFGGNQKSEPDPQLASPNAVLIERFPALQPMLDRFFHRRTGVRFLVAHLLDLCFEASIRLGDGFPIGREVYGATGSGPGTPSYYYGYDASDFVGIICKRMELEHIVRIAADHVTAQSHSALGACPPIELITHGCDPIAHVPQPIYTMACLLLRNAALAVVERQKACNALEGAEPSEELPPIRVDICVSPAGQVTLRVSDEGGGIPRSKMHKMQSYLYTTRPTPIFCARTGGEMSTGESAVPGGQEEEGGEKPADHIISGPLGGVNSLPYAGHGYGLPITRQIARYYGGEFELISQEGLGTDAFVYLPPLVDVKENSSHWRLKGDDYSYSKYQPEK